MPSAWSVHRKHHGRASRLCGGLRGDSPLLYGTCRPFPPSYTHLYLQIHRTFVRFAGLAVGKDHLTHQRWDFLCAFDFILQLQRRHAFTLMHAHTPSAAHSDALLKPHANGTCICTHACASVPWGPWGEERREERHSEPWEKGVEICRSSVRLIN